MNDRIAKILDRADHPGTSDLEALAAVRRAYAILDERGLTFVTSGLRTTQQRDDSQLESLKRENDRLRRQLSELSTDIERLKNPPSNVKAIRDAVRQSSTTADALRRLGWTINTDSYRRLKRVCAEHGISTDHFLGQAWRKGLSR